MVTDVSVNVKNGVPLPISMFYVRETEANASSQRGKGIGLDRQRQNWVKANATEAKYQEIIVNMEKSHKAEILALQNKVQKLQIRLSAVDTTPPIKRWIQISERDDKIQMEMGFRTKKHVLAFIDFLCNGKCKSSFG